MRWSSRAVFRLSVLFVLTAAIAQTGCELVDPPEMRPSNAEGLGVSLVFPPNDREAGDKALLPDSLRIRLFRLGVESSSQFTERPAFSDSSFFVAIDVASDEPVVLEIEGVASTTFWRLFVEADSLLGKTTFPIEPSDLQRSVRVILADTSLVEQAGDAIMTYPGFPAGALSEPSGVDHDGTQVVYPVQVANIQSLAGLDLRFALVGADNQTTEVDILLDPACRLFQDADSADDASLTPELTPLDFPGNPPAYRLRFSSPDGIDPPAALEPGSEILFYVVASGTSLPDELCVHDASAFGYTFPESERVSLNVLDGQDACEFEPVGVTVADPGGDLVSGEPVTLFFDVQESWGDSVLVELTNDETTEPCLTIGRVATSDTSVVWDEVWRGRCEGTVAGYRIRVTDLETGIGAVNPTSFSIIGGDQPRPDLTLASLSFLPEEPNTDDEITITAVISNQGAAPVGPSQLSVTVGEDTTILAVRELAVGASQPVTHTVVLETAGDYLVVATADPEQEIDETDEANNVASTTISVISVSPVSADLVIESLTFLPESPAIGQLVTFTATVTNAGSGPASASQASITIGDDATAFPVPVLEPGASRVISREFSFEAAGDFVVTATADVLDEVTELDEENNSASTTVTVVAEPPPLADLVIQSVTHSPLQPQVDEEITFTAVVENAGDGPAGASQLEFFYGEDTTSLPVPPLAAGATHEATLLLTVGFAGEFTVVVTADVLEEVDESDETNNTATTTVTVVDTLPDLTVQSLTYLPADPDTDDLITFEAVIRNDGNGPAPPTTVTIDISENIASVPVPALLPGESHAAIRELVLADMGQYFVLAAVDPLDEIVETDESNNGASIELSVSLAGDLIAHALQISIPYSVTASTAGFSDDYDEVCPFEGSTAPDVVYTFVPDATTHIMVDMLGSEYDTKIYIYDEDLNLVDCNDDYHEDFTSLLANVPVLGGSRYYLVIDGYADEFGAYTMQLTSTMPCVIDCVGDNDEGEPPLELDYIDLWNGGCNTTTFDPVFQQIGIGVFCGVSGYYIGDSVEKRDTDWFQVDLPASGLLTIIGNAEQPSYMYQLSSNDCDAIEVLQIVEIGPCAENNMYIQGAPFTSAWIWVGPQVFASPNGNDVEEFEYRLDITEESAGGAIKHRRPKPGFVPDFGGTRP